LVRHLFRQSQSQLNASWQQPTSKSSMAFSVLGFVVLISSPIKRKVYQGQYLSYCYKATVNRRRWKVYNILLLTFDSHHFEHDRLSYFGLAHSHLDFHDFSRDFLNFSPYFLISMIFLLQNLTSRLKSSVVFTLHFSVFAGEFEGSCHLIFLLDFYFLLDCSPDFSCYEIDGLSTILVSRLVQI
jgi:hypothetical protein